MINKHLSKRGFTLLETLVAILILTMAVSAPIYIAGKSLQDARISKDETTAYYLAQDAIEYIRYARDSNTLGGQPWLTGLSSCISSDGTATCTIDSFSGAVAPCDEVCRRLQYDPTANGGYYTYASGNYSIFTRTISIVSPSATIPSANEGFLTVTVEWIDGGTVVHHIQVEEDLLNWQ